MKLLTSIWLIAGWFSFYQTPVLESRSVIENTVSIKMPVEWKPMPDYQIKIKYPGSNPPKHVFSDKSGTISIAFNLTESKASPQVLEQYLNVLKKSLEDAYPSAEWQSSEITTINNKKVGVFKLLTPVKDDTIFNYFVFTDVNGKLLITTFNCPERKVKDWGRVSEEMMGSLEVR
ncbi:MULTISPECIES: hypothetical protein [unclassified Paraflavitalea]|uniref:hypothetical protein n=1 Tax=unclassified Paraflavitalea TaxID=2798305 RepID=UPI003D3267DF